MAFFDTLIALSILLSAVTFPGGQPSSIPSVENIQQDAEATRWVDSVYNSMTERQRVAQLFVPRLDITDNAAGRADITRMVEAGVGGFLLGKGTIDDYAALIALAQSKARVPLMVTLDGEWGLSMRVKDTPRFPYNMGLGAIADESLLYDYGREVGRECRAIGIQVDFAPVLDVNSNPSNPVIGYRSFGEDPERVARLGVAYSKGMESQGVLSVSKHFPGHGDTSVDSHKGLPTIDHPLSTLESVDLLPFRAYIDEGLSGVMVGHLNVPALDPSGTPASQSKAIITDYLKGKMQFRGLVFTDALAMKGANAKVNNCVGALMAGADVLLGSSSPLNDITAVLSAVQEGRISRATLEERCRKMLYYKYALGLDVTPTPLPTAQIRALINSPEAEDVNRRLSAASITCVFNHNNLLPLRDLRHNKIAVVALGASATCPFVEYCRKYADAEVFASTDGSLSADQLRRIASADRVVIGVFSDDRAIRAVYSKLNDLPRAVSAFFITPYRMSNFADGIRRHDALIAAYDNTPYLQEYAAQAIFGGIAVDGRMPVNVSGVAKAGEGVDLGKCRLSFVSPITAGVDPSFEASVDSLVTAAMKSGAFPGCQVLVARRGEIFFDRAYGVLTNSAPQAYVGKPVNTATLYDIASMSKAVGTLGGIMKAYQEGLIDLQAPVGRYLADAQDLPVGNITVSDLLFHRSGLQPSLNMFRMMTDPQSYEGKLTSSSSAPPYTIKIDRNLYGNSNARLRTDILSTSPDGQRHPLKIAEGLYGGYDTRDSIYSAICHLTLGEKKYRYSCLNFCLLMAIEEAVTEVDHEQWVDLEIFQPLGAYNTLYCPTSAQVPLSRIAPTETDNFLRRQTVHGYAHDELAAFSGGVQGNAGLFSTAEDIAKYCQMLLNDGAYGGEQILDAATVETFTTTLSPDGRRGLGFDIKSATAAHPRLIGHTGFTGTCFWIDPDQELIFIFLSNRINPARTNSAWSSASIRDRLLDLVYSRLR